MPSKKKIERQKEERENSIHHPLMHDTPFGTSAESEKEKIEGKQDYESSRIDPNTTYNTTVWSVAELFHYLPSFHKSELKITAEMKIKL